MSWHPAASRASRSGTGPNGLQRLKLRAELCSCRGLLFLLLLGVAPNAVAELPIARLTSVFPPGGSAGTCMQVTALGVDLDDPVALLFSDPRISGEPDTNAAGSFRVIIPNQVPPGKLDVRFHGRFGVSNPRTFVISQSPEVLVAPEATSRETAMDLALDTVANGRMVGSSVVWFRIHPRSASRATACVESGELDSRLNPVLTLFNEEGRQLKRSLHGLLDIRPANEGALFLALHDLTFRGGDEFPFRLVVKTTPHVDFASPSVLQPGASHQVAIYGRNLPGGMISDEKGPDGEPLESAWVTILAPSPGEASQAPPGRLASIATRGFWWRCVSGPGVSNPIFFSLTESPAVFISALSNEVATVQPPCDYVGRLGKAREIRGVGFEARKGDVWWLEVFSERLGFPANPHLLIQREVTRADRVPAFADVLELGDQEANFGDPGYPTDSRDPVGRLQVPEDGSYRIHVRDLFNPWPGRPRYPFQLVVRPETPDFRLVVTAVSPPVSDPNQRPLTTIATFLRRGETLPLRVFAFRRDGFNEEIEITATNLPAGVVAFPASIPVGKNAATIFLHADRDVAGGVSWIKVLGSARFRDKVMVREAIAAGVRWQVTDYAQEPTSARFMSNLPVSVSEDESAPIEIHVPGQPVDGVEKGKISIPLRLTRLAGFGGELKLRAFGSPELEKLPELVVPSGATNATLEINLADQKLGTGKHRAFLRGFTSGAYRKDAALVSAATLAVEQGKARLATAKEEEAEGAAMELKAAEERLRTVSEKTKPKDVSVTVYSPSFVMNIAPPPQ